MLVGTNGKVTERSYFSGVKELGWITAGRVVVAYEHGSPIDAVRAVGRRKADNDFDHAWVVCDVDDFDTAAADREAQKRDVRLAWSNPCFEVWLLLHLTGHTAHLESAGKACERVGKVLGRGWDKSRFDFADFEGGVADAVKRARALAAAPGGNPSTDVWRVLEELGYPRP
ncbi:RloB family protein [Symbioplanes lichenis]|uniref:RloB family protein n=1 Tax=Symbioplanes lichenis TaxID=1629072 RepID=UPI00273941A1|nr:RloB family protein [Actinoplanes lichenis]